MGYTRAVSWNRREVLGGLGIASASLLLGCHLPQPVETKPLAPSDAIRGWLRDAVGWLAPGFASVHALAVTRRRTVAAIDGLGSGVSRSRFDGVVLSVRDKAGRREQITSDLTQAGVGRAILLLAGTTNRAARLSFGGAPVIVAPKLKGDPRLLDDRALIARVITTDTTTSRIVYTAGLLEIDDTTTWSIAPDHDREQRIVRVRRTATRVAWNGTRPVVGESSIAWAGGIDDRVLTLAELHAATLGATELMTPGSFPEGERELLLDPSVTAAAVDAMARTLFTAEAQRRPELARRSAIVAPMLELVDDPTTPHAYGGFAFDDAGALAAPVTLLGRTSSTLGAGRERRPGGVGRLAAMPSHLRLGASDGDPGNMLIDGFALEGGGRVVLDPSSDRIAISVARARELASGATTGRVFADVELVGTLTGLLASTSGLSRETRAFGLREDIDGEPTWRSIETPWLRCRGSVRTRKGAA